MDTRQIHAAHLEELGAQIELRRIARAPTLLAIGRFTVVRLQTLELLLNFAFALAQLRADEVELCQRLLEREQVFGSPVSRERLLHVLHVQIGRAHV